MEIGAVNNDYSTKEVNNKKWWQQEPATNIDGAASYVACNSVWDVAAGRETV